MPTVKIIKGIRVVFGSDPTETAKKCLAMFDKLRLSRHGARALPAPEVFRLPVADSVEEAQR